MIKSRVSEAAILVHPRLDVLFHLHRDSSNHQIGCAVSQLGLSLGSFSKQLNGAQHKHPDADKELLAMGKGC